MDGDSVFWIVALMFAFLCLFIGYAMGYEKGRQDYRKYILLHFELIRRRFKGRREYDDPEV
jgi:hypothetical protein